MFASLLIQGFHFAFQLRTNLPPVASDRDLFRILSNAKYTNVPSGAASATNGRYLPISGANSWTSPSVSNTLSKCHSGISCRASGLVQIDYSLTKAGNLLLAVSGTSVPVSRLGFADDVHASFSGLSGVSRLFIHTF
jgi:hypothetical protein